MPSLTITGVEDDATRLRFSTVQARVEATLQGKSVCVAAQPVKRTFKLLMALARGDWIVGEAVCHERLELTAH